MNLNSHDILIKNNTLTGYANEGISLSGPHKNVSGSHASGFAVGIVLDPTGPASSNFVSGNTVSGNTTFDMEDDNATCDSNVWVSNTFGTRNQTFIH